MSGVRGCPMCGSGNALEATQCWVCGAALAAGAAPPRTALAKQQQTPDSGQTFRILGWVAFLLAIFTICTLVGVELALEWPGLLVPFALITLVVFGALGRIAYVQLRTPPATPSPPGQGQPSGQAPKKGGVTGNEVLQGVALGFAIAGAIVAAMILLFVAAMVIFFMICLALVVGAGGMH